MLALQGGVERPVVEPGRAALRAGEALKRDRELRELTGLEAQEGLPEETLLAGRRGRIVDAGALGDFPGGKRFRRQQAVGDQGLRRDEQRIAGEGRERVVGRIAHAGGAHRQNLPDGETGADHPVEHGVRRRAEVADGEPAR